MKWLRRGLAPLGLLGLALLAGPAEGGPPATPVPTKQAAPAAAPTKDAAPAPETPRAPAGQSQLDLSIRARALGLAPEPLEEPSMGLETMRAPTGAGRLTWPQPTPPGRGPGFYVGVVPVCVPGEDLPPLPGRRRR